MYTFSTNTRRSAFVVVEFVRTVEIMRYLLVPWSLVLKPENKAPSS